MRSGTAEPALRQRSANLRQQRLYGVDDTDDIGPGLSLNIKNYGRGIVHPGFLVIILRAIDDRGHIGEQYCHLGTAGHDS